MKTLIALFSVLTLNVAHAEMGTIESFFTPSNDKHEHDQIVHLYLQNNCNQEVYIATRSQNPNEVWETKGYMRVFPGQVIPAGDMINNIYYLNAFTGDHRVNWEGEHSFEIRGRNVRALLVELPKDYGGNWTTVLYCY
ncbi:MAG: DUF1036 domain-containing protein [Rhizobacter sp.]|nr:DUF1036 domain-containing protein [Bacteriovorax sp.]